MLRGRPFAFGALLAFGFVHREFTMYALPGARARRARRRLVLDREHGQASGAQARGGFALVWLILDDAKMHSERKLAAPPGATAGQVHLFRRADACSNAARYVFTDVWPVLTGGTRMPLGHYAMRSSAVVGSADHRMDGRAARCC